MHFLSDRIFLSSLQRPPFCNDCPTRAASLERLLRLSSCVVTQHTTGATFLSQLIILSGDLVWKALLSAKPPAAEGPSLRDKRPVILFSWSACSITWRLSSKKRLSVVVWNSTKTCSGANEEMCGETICYFKTVILRGIIGLFLIFLEEPVFPFLSQTNSRYVNLQIWCNSFPLEASWLLRCLFSENYRLQSSRGHLPKRWQPGGWSMRLDIRIPEPQSSFWGTSQASFLRWLYIYSMAACYGIVCEASPLLMLWAEANRWNEWLQFSLLCLIELADPVYCLIWSLVNIQSVYPHSILTVWLVLTFVA